MRGENGIAQTENEFESIQKSRTAGDRAFAAFFPRFLFPTGYNRMHKYTLPVNKISRPRKKDSRAVYRTSCATVMPRSLATQPRPIAIFFLSPLVTLFIFFPLLPLLSVSLTLHYRHENDAVVNRGVKKCCRIIKL